MFSNCSTSLLATASPLCAVDSLHQLSRLTDADSQSISRHALRHEGIFWHGQNGYRFWDNLQTIFFLWSSFFPVGRMKEIPLPLSLRHGSMRRDADGVYIYTHWFHKTIKAVPVKRFTVPPPPPPPPIKWKSDNLVAVVGDVGWA